MSIGRKINSLKEEAYDLEIELQTAPNSPPPEPITQKSRPANSFARNSIESGLTAREYRRSNFRIADNPSRIGRARSAIFHGGRERRKDIRLLAEGSSVQIQNRESNVGVRSQ